MTIALKHNNTTIIGIYENKLDFAYSNFNFTYNEGYIKVKSKLFDCYKEKEIISTISFSKEYTEEEAINGYIRYSLKSDIKRYGINLYKLE